MKRATKQHSSHSTHGKRRHEPSKLTSESAVGRHDDHRTSRSSTKAASKAASENVLNVIEKTSITVSENSLQSSGNIPSWMRSSVGEVHPRGRSIPDFLAGGHYGYTQEVYVAAAQLFEALAVRKDVGECLVQYAPLPDNPTLPKFETPKSKRQAYELAYETLKYQEILEEVLSESGYFFVHPTSEDSTALLMVMLFDFQNRKWSARCHIVGEGTLKEVVEMEESLVDQQVHLAAALARCRVKNQSLSIDYVLPESVREQEKSASLLPQCGWVNTVKSGVHEVVKALERDGYIEFKDSNLPMPGYGILYCIDPRCDDVISFPSDQKEALKSLGVVADGSLVLQDKTSSLIVQSVKALLTEDDECDLVHADVASGLTTAHLAIVLHNKTKKRFETKKMMYSSSISAHSSKILSSNISQEFDDDTAAHRSRVYAFGVRSESHRDYLTSLFKNMGLKNVVLLNDKFESIDPSKDSRFEKVKVVLVTPQCTRTAIANPVEFMLNEGDHDYFDILRDLSLGERHKKATESGRRHTETLKFSLKYPSLHAVVYATRSIHSSENEIVVYNAIKWHKESVAGRRSFKAVPPILPLTSDDAKDGEHTSGLDSAKSDSHPHQNNFFRLLQTPEMNGCFIAVLSREISGKDKDAAMMELRRSALQGLIAPTKTPAAAHVAPPAAATAAAAEKKKSTSLHFPQVILEEAEQPAVGILKKEAPIKAVTAKPVSVAATSKPPRQSFTTKPAAPSVPRAFKPPNKEAAENTKVVERKQTEMVGLTPTNVNFDQLKNSPESKGGKLRETPGKLRRGLTPATSVTALDQLFDENEKALPPATE